MNAVDHPFGGGGRPAPRPSEDREQKYASGPKGWFHCRKEDR